MLRFVFSFVPALGAVTVPVFVGERRSVEPEPLPGTRVVAGRASPEAAWILEREGLAVRVLPRPFVLHASG